MLSNQIFIFYDYKQMYPEPRYLELEEQFFPSITLYKQLIFDCDEDGFHYEMFERVAYDSERRCIDLTESINFAINKEYSAQNELEILVYDPCQLNFRLLAYFPYQNSITLGQQFLQLDVLIFQIKRHISPLEEFQDQIHNQMGHFEANPAHSIEITEEVEVEEKLKRRKTIKEMLEAVDVWRKILTQSNFKLNVQEGANLMGISKRSLQFYIHNVKLGQKFGYPFQHNLDKKISELKKFVNQNTQSKKIQEIQMLNKLKNYYK